MSFVFAFSRASRSGLVETNSYPPRLGARLLVKAGQMKTAWIMLAALGLLAVLPAVSGEKLCSAIRSDRQRLACFDREASRTEPNERPTSDGLTKPGLAIIDPVDLLKAENEKLSMQLRGICRGC